MVEWARLRWGAVPGVANPRSSFSWGLVRIPLRDLWSSSPERKKKEFRGFASCTFTNTVTILIRDSPGSHSTHGLYIQI